MTTNKNGIEFDIDDIITDLNGKADVDLANVNNSGTSKSSEWGMPSNTYDNLSLGANGVTYTAPANGYFCFYGTASAMNGGIALTNNSSFSIGSQNYSNGGLLSVLLPAKKNDVVKFEYWNGTPTTIVFKFIYSKGCEWEA